MRKYILGGFLILILGTSWILFLESRNQRFVESLPKPLQIEKRATDKPKQRSPENQEQEVSRETENEEVKVPSSRDSQRSQRLPESETHTHETEPHHEHSHETETEPEQEHHPPLDVSNMSPEEIAKMAAKDFLAETEGKHRQEVETIERLLPKLLRPNQKMSLKERYEFQKALAKLNPTPKNLEGLRVMEERMKRHRDYPPGTPRPSEHVRDNTAEERSR